MLAAGRTTFALILLTAPAAAQPYPTTYSGPFVKHTVQIWMPSASRMYSACTLRAGGQQFQGSGTLTINSARASIPIDVRCEEQLSTHKAITQFTGTLNLTVPAETPILTSQSGAFQAPADSGFSTSAEMSGSVRVVQGFNAQSTPEGNIELSHGTNRCAKREEFARQSSVSVNLACSDARPDLAQKYVGTDLIVRMFERYANPPGVPVSSTQAAFQVRVESAYDISSPVPKVEPATLDISVGAGSLGTPAAFEARNDGGGRLEWRVRGQPARVSTYPGGESYELRVAPSGGVLLRNQKEPVSITVDAKNMTGEKSRRIEQVSLEFLIDQGRTMNVAVNVTILPPGQTPDAVEIVRADPAAGTELSGAGPFRFTALVRHSLGSTASGLVDLTLLDQNGKALASAAPVLVQRGRVAESEMTIDDLRLSPDVTQLTLRATLHAQPGPLQLKEHSLRPYTVATLRSDRIGLTGVTPDPKVPLGADQEVQLCGIVSAQVETRAQADYALRAFDQDGVLAGSSDWITIRSSDGLNARKLCTPNIKLTGVKRLRLKAVLMEPIVLRPLKETETVEFTVEEYRIRHIEFVQTVQRGQNEVPLIPLKPILARAFIEWLGSGSSSEPVSGKLSLRYEGKAYVSYSPLNAPIRPKRNPDRSILDDTLNFELDPGVWPPLTVEFELLDSKGIPKNLKKTVPLELAGNRDRVLIGLVPVCYAPGNPDPDRCTNFQWPAVPGTDFLRPLFPAFRVDFAWVTAKPLEWWEGALTVDGNAEALTRKIYKQYGRHISNAGLTQLFGVLPDLRSSAEIPLGKSSPLWYRSDANGITGWFQRLPDSRITQQIVAHEMGHNFGLRHAGGNDFCGASNPVGWPYADSTVQDPGWNNLTRKLVPASAADVMSNCAGALTVPVWASAHTVKGLIGSEFKPGSQVPAPSASRQKPAVSASHIRVGGKAQRDGSAGSLDPVAFAVSEAPVHRHNPEGSHCLEFEGGQPGKFCFDLRFEAGDTWGPSSGAPVDEQRFLFELDAPERLERLALTRQGRELAALALSPSAPVVRIEAPAAAAEWAEGNHTILWNASDADGDPLLFDVDYSADDGRTWMPLETGLSDSRLMVRSSQIAGGGSVRFRVTATDGLRSASAEAGPVSVRQRPAIKLPAGTLAAGPAVVGAGRDTDVGVENTGSGPLLLQSVSSDNPAYRIELPVTPLLVPAGASVPLVVRFLPEAAGTQTANLVVRSNDPSLPEARMVITGNATAAPTPEAVIEPAALDFGVVQVGQAASLRFTIENRGTGTLRIDSVTSSDPQFSAAGSPPPPVLDQEKTTVEVTFRPAAEGQRAGRLLLRTNDPRRETIEIQVSGRGVAASAPSIQVTPAGLSFGEVTAGQSKSLALSVRNTGSAALSVSRVSSDNTAFTVLSPGAAFSVAPGAGQEVTVRFAPQAAGAQTGRLTVASNAANQPSLTVSLTGTGAAVPAGPVTPILQIDDGVFESTLRPPDAVSELHMVNRLTPPSYPATLTKVQIYFHDRGGGPERGSSVGILYGSAAAGVEVDGTRLRVLARLVPDTGKFIEYEVPPLTIESGHFVVGFHTPLEASGQPAAVDITTPNNGRSLISRDGIGFSSLGVNGVFGFRAVLSVGK